ncbi:hypothetical protein K8I61_17025 [bacterium]|nr:hypothetical protein [bacterium]
MSAKRKDRQTLRVLLAVHAVPGIVAIETLFAEGVRPENVALLTHPLDDANGAFLSYAWSQGFTPAFFPAASDEALEWAREFSPDVLFALHYGERIPRGILDLPPLGCVNMHPALLPNYRGCFSTAWCIINGEPQTGVTFHRMTERFDAGDIVRQDAVPIRPDDTTHSLSHRLMLAGVTAFGDVFRRVVDDEDPGRPQAGEGSYFGWRVPYDGVIDPAWDDARVDRFIRAMDAPPARGAIVKVEGEEIEVRSMDEWRAIRERIREASS